MSSKSVHRHACLPKNNRESADHFGHLSRPIQGGPRSCHGNMPQGAWKNSTGTPTSTRESKGNRPLTVRGVLCEWQGKNASVLQIYPLQTFGGVTTPLLQIRPRGADVDQPREGPGGQGPRPGGPLPPPWNCGEPACAPRQEPGLHQRPGGTLHRRAAAGHALHGARRPGDSLQTPGLLFQHPLPPPVPLLCIHMPCGGHFLVAVVLLLVVMTLSHAWISWQNRAAMVFVLGGIMFPSQSPGLLLCLLSLASHESSLVAWCEAEAHSDALLSDHARKIVDHPAGRLGSGDVVSSGCAKEVGRKCFMVSCCPPMTSLLCGRHSPGTVKCSSRQSACQTSAASALPH